MEVASEGDRGTRETPALNFQIVFWRLRRRLGGEFVMNRPGPPGFLWSTFLAAMQGV
jgi:hypothetical protein